MNPPMINSTNSVSTTRRKREAERSVNWTVEETQVLLCAWSDERVQKSLAENLRNRHVFKHLSARMSEMGFSRSPHQCRLRVKTLKANYVRAKLQKSVDSSQPCTFKYFAEMDAVLGRRSVGGPYFVSPEQMAECHPNSIDRTGSVPLDLNSSTEITEHHFGSLGRTGRQFMSSVDGRGGRQSWQLDSDVKLEDGGDSTDEFEFNNAGFPQCPRDRCHEVWSLESSVHRDMSGTTVENSLSTPSPHVVPPPSPPPPPPPLTQSTGSPLPAPPDPSPSTLPTSGHHPLESSRLEPVLKHLLESFHRLVSETRGLLVQVEGQRQEHARWHQELLAQWLQREERRQRETAEREERREKARMEHEIRVLELLTGLAREHGCKCGGGQTVSGAASSSSHNTNEDRK
ncbi:uncharacterized protein LOC111660927 [Seriola lalandi dorsalis]|uniref:uncharacterized protein LOC111660927 n=1 Tax=Seriola lalandi dorsalis TaxID=1841481 RepID=UPI000C6F7B36|nr:uncharacterized protein LOC111660927 [Seriola lalandi dorsalis]